MGKKVKIMINCKEEMEGEWIKEGERKRERGNEKKR